MKVVLLLFYLLRVLFSVALEAIRSVRWPTAPVAVSLSTVSLDGWQHGARQHWVWLWTDSFFMPRDTCLVYIMSLECAENARLFHTSFETTSVDSTYFTLPQTKNVPCVCVCVCLHLVRWFTASIHGDTSHSQVTILFLLVSRVWHSYICFCLHPELDTATFVSDTRISSCSIELVTFVVFLRPLMDGFQVFGELDHCSATFILLGQKECHPRNCWPQQFPTFPAMWRKPTHPFE